MTEQIITESTKIYPRGRGKVLVISEKQVIPKPKNGKKAKSLVLFAVKSNPQPIVLKMYINNGRKRFVLFPEGRILQYEERMELAGALIATLKHKCVSISPRIPYYRLTVNKHSDFRGLVSQDLRNQTKEKIKKIERFQRRNEE